MGFSDDSYFPVEAICRAESRSNLAFGVTRFVHTSPQLCQLLGCWAVEELVKFFGLAFTALVPLVNPLGDALIFLSLVGGAPPAVYSELARKIAINTRIFLITIEAERVANP